MCLLVATCATRKLSGKTVKSASILLLLLPFLACLNGTVRDADSRFRINNRIRPRPLCWLHVHINRGNSKQLQRLQQSACGKAGRAFQTGCPHWLNCVQCSLRTLSSLNPLCLLLHAGGHTVSWGSRFHVENIACDCLQCWNPSAYLEVAPVLCLLHCK